MPQKGREGFLDLNAKPDTDSQLYLTILIYRSGLLNEYFKLDAMNNPQKSISADIFPPLQPSKMTTTIVPRRSGRIG